MDTTSRRLGFIGLGKMGYPMAGRLYQAGHELTLFDAAESQVEKFIAQHSGAASADSLAALEQADAVITMLPSSIEVDATVLGLIDILPSGATIIDMSSSQPMRSRALAKVLEEKGLHFLDAPVSGGVKGAVSGKLSIMVGGKKKEFHRFLEVFECMGQKVTHVGGPGAGHALKSLNNYVSAAGLAAATEALHLGRKFGLDPAVMTDVLNSSTGQNYATTNKVKQYMLSGTFDSGFSLQLMVKDLRTAMNLGDELDLDMRLGREVLQLWSDAGDELEPSADHTEVYRYLQKALEDFS